MLFIKMSWHQATDKKSIILSFPGEAGYWTYLSTCLITSKEKSLSKQPIYNLGQSYKYFVTLIWMKQ